MGSEKKKKKRALHYAHDIRKFEIDLYWKRSAYFWAFNALAIAGYGTLLVQDSKNEFEHLTFLLSNVGVVASVAWFLANKGSKHWQEQWETHIERLENDITGALYKKTFKRDPECRSQSEKSWITDSGRFSVSKINQMGSVHVTIVWIVLLAESFPWKLFYLTVDSWKYVVFILLTIPTLLALLWCGRTRNKCYDYDVQTRRVECRKYLPCPCHICQKKS